MRNDNVSFSYELSKKVCDGCFEARMAVKGVRYTTFISFDTTEALIGRCM